MSLFITKIQVNKPVEQTFSLFLDENVMQHWITGFKGIEILRGEPREADSLYRMLIHFDGQDIQIYQKLLEVYPNEKLLVQMEHPEFLTYTEVFFQKDGKATLMESKVKIQGKSFRVKLAMPIVKNIIESRNKRDYLTFKKLAEKMKRKK